MTLRKGHLPFVVGHRDAWKARYHKISLKAFKEYVESYRPEIPGDLRDEEAVETLSSLEIDLKEFLGEIPSAEEVMKKVRKKIYGEGVRGARGVRKEEAEPRFEKEAQTGLIEEKPESSSKLEKAGEERFSDTSDTFEENLTKMTPESPLL